MTDELRAAIRMDGPIPFERFMDLALYGHEGFYTGESGGSAGRRGDFLTSPEVGPLFGAVVARWVDERWRGLGRPDEFTVVEVGAGPGTLARAIRSAAPEVGDALPYLAVELSARQRELHPDGVESLTDLPEGPLTGVVVLNEVLDNVPFRLVVFDGGWREAYVDVDRGGAFVEVLSDRLDPVPHVLPSTVPTGARAPLVDRAAEIVSDACGLLGQGSVLAFDYGVPRTAELALRPWRDWLRTYRTNERGAHYLSDAGRQDVTIDVPFDQLPPPDSTRTQEQFLRLHGIDDLVDEGRRVWTAQAASPGLEAMRMRSRVREAEALLDPTGLGGFLALEWHP